MHNISVSEYFAIFISIAAALAPVAFFIYVISQKFKKNYVKRKAQKVRQYKETHLDLDNKCVKIGQELAKKLIEKNIGNYLFQQFEFKTQLSNVDLFDDEIIEQKIRDLIFECLTYLNLMPLVKVHIHYGKNEMREKYGMDNAAGLFKGSTLNGEISILIEPTYTADNVRAVICHECTHYFMRSNGLEIDDRDLNEIHTDIYANLIGFNRYLKNGYTSVVTEHTLVDKRYTQTHRIGYISDIDCRQLGFLLADKKDYFKSEIESRDEKKGTDIYREFQDQLHELTLLNSKYKIIDFKKMHTKNSASIMLIQASIKKYEEMDIDDQIRKYENNYNKTDSAEKIQNATKLIKKYNSTLKTILDDISKISA